MDSPWLVPVALFFGLLVGAGATTAVVLAHRRGQQAVEVSAARVPEGIESLIDALENVGAVIDPSNNVLVASARAISTGLVWHDQLVHPELVEYVDQVRRDGTPVGEELHLTRGRLGEQSLFLQVRIARLGSRYILLLADDRTEARRLEEVRRDFVANVSHELKTPIGAVGLLAEALQSAATDPDQVRRFASRLSVESDRLARLTNEIIELSRVQAGDTLDRAERVDIDRVVQQAIDHNRVAADAKSITLVTGKRVRVEVVGDPQLLVTALNNLISNAITYSPPHSRVGVGVDSDDGIVEIAVADQGVGIPEADRDRVFERFYRVDSARARDTGGTGLGLSIVKHVVQNHGGDVRLWSRPGKGSTFTVRLPEATAASATSLGAAP
ncbi:MAG: two-component sensor histidine kinase [Micrococcales bacterium]|nr:two-component sensor histidine kinase [Micrococcales bacterium]